MTPPISTDEAADEAEPDADAEQEGYVCGPCQRGKHRGCRSPECVCCEADPG